jgi:hypothetical protein
MQDTALAAVHRVETERSLDLLGALGCLRRAGPEFLNAQHAMVVRIEADPAMLFGGHA